MAILRTISAVTLLTMVLMGCSGVRRVTHGPTAVVSLKRAQVEQIIQRVTEVRQLKLRKTVPVERLDHAGMVAKITEMAGQKENGGREAALVAFNLLEDRDPSSLFVDLGLGLYDTKSKTLYYRADGVSSEEDLLKQRLVIAHEAHRSIQDQHFGTAAKVPEQLDGALALMALFEGDAEVTMASFYGAEYGVPLSRTLRAISDIRKELRAEDVAHLVLNDHSVAVTNRLLLFPWDDGMRFVADIYRAGGLELVDRMYEKPPRSSEHILHPDKYLAGELPTPVSTPAPPSGYRVVDQDVLGEIGISQVLSPCIGEAKAAQAAVGWAGDRYAVAADGGGRISLMWVTVWDDEDRAAEFAELLEQRGECWSGTKGGNWKVPEHVFVRRDERRVVLITGIEPAKAEEMAAGMFALVGETPAPDPLSDARVPDSEPLPKAARGTLNQNRYRSDWLGITATLPDGMDAKVGEISELEVRGQDEGYGALFMSDRIHTEGYNDQTFTRLLHTATKAIGLDDARMTALDDQKVSTPLGEGSVRLFGNRGTNFRIRVVLVPVCFGTGSYGFVQAYGSSEAKGALDGWLDTFQWASLEPPEVCKMLNPK